MTKMLEQKIEALTAAIEALTAKLDAAPITAKPEGASKPEAAPTPAPAPAPETPTNADNGDATSVPDVDAISAAAIAASRSGHGPAIKAKLAELGAPRIKKLDADGLAAFAECLEGLDL
jgi:hypothetical protein